MYIPKKFEELRLPVLHSLMAQHPLATMVTIGADGLTADHLPFVIEAPSETAPFGTLKGHVAKNNPAWKLAGQQVLLIFQGPAAYISANWYEEKTSTGAVVPTYSYAVVHAHGELKVIDDRSQLLGVLHTLTSHFEATQKNPWSIDQAPPDFIERMMDAIVGIEIPLTKVVGKWKTCQDETAQNRQNMIDGLQSAELAENLSANPVSAHLATQASCMATIISAQLFEE